MELMRDAKGKFPDGVSADLNSLTHVKATFGYNTSLGAAGPLAWPRGMASTSVAFTHLIFWTTVAVLDAGVVPLIDRHGDFYVDQPISRRHRFAWDAQTDGMQDAARAARYALSVIRTFVKQTTPHKEAKDDPIFFTPEEHAWRATTPAFFFLELLGYEDELGVVCEIALWAIVHHLDMQSHRSRR